MSVPIPKIRVGKPVRHKSLSVFPLFNDELDSESGSLEYLLSGEALANDSVVVEEIDESGSVPELVVDNRSNHRVLFIEGEELIGAKQNRILNTTILIDARSRIKVPVSCVEQGRWHYRSKRFSSAGSHSPAKLRYALKKSVSDSIKEQKGHQSDQSKVWEKVGEIHAEHGSGKPNEALFAAFDSRKDQRQDFSQRIKYIEGASGLATAVGKQVVAVDLFDKPETCEKVWDRLLSGPVLDAIVAEETEQDASLEDVGRLVENVSKADWEATTAVGLGEEFRAEFEKDHASALVFQENLVHGSVLAEC